MRRNAGREGDTLPGGPNPFAHFANLSPVAQPLHPPAVVQPAAPAVPQGKGTPIGDAAPDAPPATNWTKLGILAAVGAAIVFVVAGRKKKR